MTEQDTPEFIDKLMGLLKTVVDRLDSQSAEINKLRARDDELEHQLDIIFEKQTDNQVICGDS